MIVGYLSSEILAHHCRDSRHMSGAKASRSTWAAMASKYRFGLAARGISDEDCREWTT